MKIMSMSIIARKGSPFNLINLFLLGLFLFACYHAGVSCYGLFVGDRVSDYRDLLFVTQAENEGDVIRHFGRQPDIVYHKGDVLPRMGWRLPSRPISNKIIVYDKMSSLRIYIYIDADGEVEYVFTSYS